MKVVNKTAYDTRTLRRILCAVHADLPCAGKLTWWRDLTVYAENVRSGKHGSYLAYWNGVERAQAERYKYASSQMGQLAGCCESCSGCLTHDCSARVAVLAAQRELLSCMSDYRVTPCAGVRSIRLVVPGKIVSVGLLAELWRRILFALARGERPCFSAYSVGLRPLALVPTQLGIPDDLHEVEVVPHVLTPQVRALKVRRLQARQKAWLTKQKCAEHALAKIAKQLRRLEREG